MHFQDKLSAKHAEARRLAAERIAKAANKAPQSKGPCVKVSNLAATTSAAMLKEALESWGIGSILDIRLDEEDPAGPTAMIAFKDKDAAEFSMQAQDIEVDRRPLRLELVEGAEIAPVKKGSGIITENAFGSDFGRGKVDPSTATTPVLTDDTDLIRILGVPLEAKVSDVMSFLRGHGVLGIISVQLPDEEPGHAYVQFQEAENVRSALSKVPKKATCKERKVTLEAVPKFPEDEPVGAVPEGGLPKGGFGGKGSGKKGAIPPSVARSVSKRFMQPVGFRSGGPY